MSSSQFDWLVGELEGWLHGNLNELGRHAVEAFLALPGLSGWSPQDIQRRPIDLLMLLDYGLPFALLNGNDSANALRRKIGMEIVAKGKPRQSDWSEVCAGALLQHIGAGVRFVPTSKLGKTPCRQYDCRSRSNCC